jgi:RimJ/RimL family protein N-acetyltransferase
LIELQTWTTWAAAEPSPIEAMEARLAKFHADFEAGVDWGYAVLSQDENMVLGGAGLHPRRGPGALEIGYWIHSDHTGQGLATEVAAALTRRGFADHGVDRLEIRCDPLNLRSAAIPRGLGYQLVSVLQNDFPMADGRLRDTMVWVLVRSEWEAGLRVGAPGHK